MKYLLQILTINLLLLVGCKNDTDYIVEKEDSKIYTSFEKKYGPYSREGWKNLKIEDDEDDDEDNVNTNSNSNTNTV